MELELSSLQSTMEDILTSTGSTCSDSDCSSYKHTHEGRTDCETCNKNYRHKYSHSCELGRGTGSRPDATGLTDDENMPEPRCAFEEADEAAGREGLDYPESDEEPEGGVHGRDSQATNEASGSSSQGSAYDLPPMSPQPCVEGSGDEYDAGVSSSGESVDGHEASKAPDRHARKSADGNKHDSDNHGRMPQGTGNGLGSQPR